MEWNYDFADNWERESTKYHDRARPRSHSTFLTAVLRGAYYVMWSMETYHRGTVFFLFFVLFWFCLFMFLLLLLWLWLFLFFCSPFPIHLHSLFFLRIAQKNNNGSVETVSLFLFLFGHAFDILVLVCLCRRVCVCEWMNVFVPYETVFSISFHRYLNLFLVAFIAFIWIMNESSWMECLCVYCAYSLNSVSLVSSSSSSSHSPVTIIILFPFCELVRSVSWFVDFSSIKLQSVHCKATAHIIDCLFFWPLFRSLRSALGFCFAQDFFCYSSIFLFWFALKTGFHFIVFFKVDCENMIIIHRRRWRRPRYGQQRQW